MASSTSPVFFYKDGVPMPKKRKARFTFSEVHILLDEVRKNRHIVVGKFNYGVPSTVKKHTWAEITARINEIGECEREVIEVIKKWSDLKCDTKRKVAALRTGSAGLLGSRYLREFTYTENIIRQILELDGKQDGHQPGDSNGNSNGNGNSTVMGLGEGEDRAGEEDDEMDMMAGMGFTNSSPEAGEGPRGVGTGGRDSPTAMPPPLGTTSVPSTPTVVMPLLPLGSKDENTERDSVFDSSGDQTSENPFEMSFEMPVAEDSNQQPDLDDDQPNSSRLSTSTPVPRANAGSSSNNTSSSGAVMHRSQTSALTLPSSSWASAPPPPLPPTSGPSPCVRAPERDSGVCSVDVGQAAVMSVQEQHMSNALLETVSRSLELLAESVQQLAETQQEFMRESLQLQSDTVQVLRDFASGAMTLMRDKLNGRPAL